jgi:hypothetical protein
MNIKRITTAPVNGTNEKQRLTLGGTITGGTFTLALNGRISDPITWTATDATLVTRVQTAMDGLLGTNETLCAEDSLTSGIGTLDITFQNNYGKLAVNALVVASSLTGTAPTAVMSTVTAGVTATARNSARGQLLMMTEGLTIDMYQNTSSTVFAPTWVPFGGGGLKSYLIGSPAVASTTGIHAAVTDTGVQVVVTTGITNPDVPRNVTATSGGTAGDIGAVQVIIAGTNINDEAITETLPIFTANSPTTVVGAKAFKTVTSITIPAHDGVGATTAIGFAEVLGLPDVLTRNTALRAFLGGVLEGTAPTVVFDSDEVEKNTVDLNSTLNSSAVIIDYYV